MPEQTNSPSGGALSSIRRFFAADRRTWVLRTSVGIVIPALFFLLIEGLLRLFGFGYETGFLLEKELAGRVVCVGNQDFGLRFFPKPLLRSPGRIMFEAKKPDDTVRVFVFGASAAMGDPLPAFAFSRTLDVMLSEQMPDKRIEVINTSITAINSNVVLHIAEDCAAYDPDLFVVYVGNNEVTGPFGPGTVFAPFAGSTTAIRWSVALKATKIGQLLSSLADGMSGYHDVPQGWGGLTMFADHAVRHDDPRLDAVYEHYRENLLSICSVAECPVILCTVGSNLRDCAPFMSGHRQGLTEPERAAWEAAFTAGKRDEARRALVEALKHCEAAAKIDPSSAELQFRLARCLEGVEQYADALVHFTKARDYDAIRIRADTTINRIVREVAAKAKEQSQTVLLADVSAALGSVGPHSVSGSESFYEHVHMNFHGNYLAARCVFEKAVDALDVPGKVRAPNDKECAERLALTSAEELHMQERILDLIRGAPFTGQIEHDEFVEANEAALRDLERRSGPEDHARMSQTYARAIEARPRDWLLHDNYARFLLLRREDPASAVREWQRTVELLPFDHLSRSNLGVALASSGQLDSARKCFDIALEIRPGDTSILAAMASSLAAAGETAAAREALTKLTAVQATGTQVRDATVAILKAEGRYDEAARRMAGDSASPGQLSEAYNALAVSLLRSAKKAEALRLLETAVELDPEKLGPQHNLARVYQGLGKHDAAAEHFERAVALAPDMMELRLSYAKALTRARRIDEALAEYERVLERGAGSARAQAQAHSDAGALLAQTGQMEKAIEHFAEAVRLEPDLLIARVNLANALGARGHHEGAALQLKRAIEISPRAADLHCMMGMELMKLGDASGARASFVQALKLNPAHALSKRKLLLLDTPAE